MRIKLSNSSKRTWQPVIFSLILLDALMLTGSFILAYWIRISSGLVLYESQGDLNIYIKIWILSLLFFIFLFYVVRLYDPNDLFYGTIEYMQVIKAVSYGIIAVIVLGFFVRPSPSRGWVIIFWLLAIFFVNLQRFVFRRIVRRHLKNGFSPDRVLIIGAGEEAKAICQRLIETGRMNVVGFLDDFNPIGQEVISGIKIKGAPNNYEKIINQEDITHIILVPGAVGWETAQEILLNVTNGNDLRISISPGFEELSASLHVTYTSYIPLLRFRLGYRTGLDKFLKFGLDLFLASCFLIVSFPIQIIIIVWILLSKGRPIFVAEEILGKFGESFKALSFRIGHSKSAYMNSFSEEHVYENNFQNKVPIFESVIFSCGLHKLPWLINTILNQMSLVGPRPLTKQTAHRYGIWLQTMLNVKPGITGPWAFQSVSNLQFEVNQIIYYINSWTPWKDLYLLFITILKIIQHLVPGLLLNRKISKNVTDKKLN